MFLNLKEVFIIFIMIFILCICVRNCISGEIYLCIFYCLNYVNLDEMYIECNYVLKVLFFCDKIDLIVF